MKLVSKFPPPPGNFFGPPHFDHDGLPSYEECRQLIRELAQSYWEAAGAPEGNGETFWLKAEQQLFYQHENHLLFGGYRVCVRDLSKPKISGYYAHYDIAIITPDGPVFLPERTPAMPRDEL